MPIASGILRANRLAVHEDIRDRINCRISGFVEFAADVDLQWSEAPREDNALRGSQVLIAKNDDRVAVEGGRDRIEYAVIQRLPEINFGDFCADHGVAGLKNERGEAKLVPRHTLSLSLRLPG